jgi:hypothetical protein
MGNPVFSLSRKGFLVDPGDKANQQMGYYLASDMSQSILYDGSIRSFQGTIQQVGNNNPSLLEARITQDLNAIFGAVFDGATATVSVTSPAFDGTYRYNIAMSVQFTEDGVPYNLPQILKSVTNGVVENLIALNNG